ncbi:MAG: hypothetical protein OXC69_08925 [Candidatus Tectomicrobia bacterium]|nr:hypothetical protein [Candidatus Tectomicrobia bacterium]
MHSLFSGTEQIICEALGIRRRAELKRRSLRLAQLSDKKSFKLVNSLYDRMMANYSGGSFSPSGMLWRCRRAPDIRDHNPNPETILEKAVANLADQGHMPGWFNQCPVASGITDPSKDRRRAIDLIHLSESKLRLIELKWASDTPAYALFEVLEYGLAYLFALLHEHDLHLERRRLMQVAQVALEVVAPSAFYEQATHSDLYTSMNTAIGRFAAEKTDGTVSMSLRALSFPAQFDRIPFGDGRAVKNRCRGDTLSDEASMVRKAFSQLVPVSLLPTGTDQLNHQNRFLPGVPAKAIEEIINAAPGNEIARGKFDSPESSAALAVNTFGFFLHRPADLPPLPGCEHAAWPANALALEATVRFPWSGGRHPVLDCLVATRSTLIGIECKRFEPFRKSAMASFSDAYWRPVWGDRMRGFEGVRDALQENSDLYSHLDAAQLVKHAFALRSEVHRAKEHHGMRPTLLYVYAEPDNWPRTGRRVEDSAKKQHRNEIAHFADCVSGDEVGFVSVTYRHVLDIWQRHSDSEIGQHAKAVIERFSP